MKRLLVAVAAAATALSLGASAMTAAAAPPAPAEDNYLAVGDSITLGLGVDPATQSFPRLLDARSRRIDLAGDPLAAPTVAVARSVLLGTAAADPAAAARITRISLTVGANDLQWVELLLACMNVPVGVACGDVLGPLVDARLGMLATDLRDLLVEASLAYPNATIHVGGYYELFGSRKRACVVAGPGGPLSISLVNKTWYNLTTRRLNTVIKTAVAAANAAGAHARFVDVASVFNGHGFCDSARPWVLGPASTAPAHPTATGQRAYARMFHAKGVR